MDKQKIINFLLGNLDKVFIIKAFIFGSLANDKPKPNDCDLFIVTNLHPKNENWAHFIEHVESVKKLFYREFNLKLNTTINTKNEFEEKSNFKERIFARKTIEII